MFKVNNKNIKLRQYQEKCLQSPALVSLNTDNFPPNGKHGPVMVRSSDSEDFFDKEMDIQKCDCLEFAISLLFQAVATNAQLIKILKVH